MDAAQLSPAGADQEIYYPSSDGEPMAETGIHVLLLLGEIAALRHHFRGRDDVYVIGNIFLYFEEGNLAARRSPDVMVIKGVPALPERTSFKTWVEGAIPCVVIELTSNETKDEDRGPKKELDDWGCASTSCSTRWASTAEELQRELDRLRALLPPGGTDHPGPA
jgi:Uma2 family endonuclease